MDASRDNPARSPTKPRVVKVAAVRRLELVDVAERLFLERGYERTTVNDVIAAAGVSKGAFYHHFRAKEDLLEAIAERLARQSREAMGAVGADPALNALGRLNGMLNLIRVRKMEAMPDLRALFAAMLRPDNALLYYRVVGAIYSAVVPAFAAVITEGQRDGVFDVADATLAAEVMLSLGEGRRRLIVEAFAVAEHGDVEGAVRIMTPRLRAEEVMIDRILGLPAGSVCLVGSDADLAAMLAEWSRS
jgi:AcrR family transcriptional regulator